MSIEEKATTFFNHILDYVQETYDEDMLAAADIDFNAEITAMLVAIKVFVEKTANWSGDIIDFTHLLNKLAIQYAFADKMEDEENV